MLVFLLDMQLSEDPFRLYQTYIHKDCIHEYMQRFKVADEADAGKAKAIPPQNDGTKNLESSGAAPQVVPATGTETKIFESIRQLPIGLDDKHAVQKDEYEAKKKSFAEYWPDDPNATPVKKSDDHDEDDGGIVYDDSDEEENNPPEPGQRIATTDSPTQRLNEEDAKPIETKSELTKKEEAQPKKDMTRSIHVNLINARKVIRAAGSRKGQKDQKAVMGFSASYVSPCLIYKP